MKDQTILHEDTNTIERAKTGVHESQKILQQFYAEMQKVLPDAVNSANFQTAVHNPKTFVRDTIAAQIPDTEYGLPVNKDARISSLKLPDLTKALELAEQYRAISRQYGVSGEFVYQIQRGEVVINETALEQFLNKSRLLSENLNEEKRKFILLQADFAKAYEALRDFAAETWGRENSRKQFDFYTPLQSADFDLKKILQGSDGKIEINPALVSHFDQFKQS